MESTPPITKIKTLFSKLPLKWWIIGGSVFLILLSYSLIFFIPKSIQFSYAEKSCSPQLVIAPDLQKFSSTEFTASFENSLRIGSVTLASTKLCVEPTQPLEAGITTVALAPFGGWIASKSIRITIPEAPAARASDLVGQTISTAQPLKIKLTSGDIVHQYTLTVADKSTDCDEVSGELACDIQALGLEHGAAYTATLNQSYKESDKKLIEGNFETLQPLVLTDASVSDGQTIYDVPTTFTLTFDSPVTEGDISLVKVTDDTTEEVTTEQQPEGTTLKISFEELDREATYRLEVKQALGDNGSSLEAPITVNFSTSGGPKVASVSVGANKVSRAAKIIVTFDQPIDTSVNIAKLARVTGVAGSVKRQSDKQFVFSIQGGDCTAFSLAIDKGLKSGSNGEASKNAWKFNSRTICGYSWVIGNSLKGRPIVAHSFGSGSKTLLFTGGMHGSEPSGYTTLQAWVTYLQAYGNTIPADKRVVIVPNTNPDGIAAGSRNNSRNVNIARNFPTANWQASIETSSGTLPTGGGKSAGSEPEAAALIKLTRQLHPRLEVSYHAQGRLVGANKFADSVAIGNIYASTVGYKTIYYNAEAVMGYPMTGEYEDWMGEEMNIPAILIELPSHSGNYLNSQMAALKKMLAI